MNTLCNFIKGIFSIILFVVILCSSSEAGFWMYDYVGSHEPSAYQIDDTGNGYARSLTITPNAYPYSPNGSWWVGCEVDPPDNNLAYNYLDRYRIIGNGNFTLDYNSEQ
jgi:hypothetical protein